MIDWVKADSSDPWEARNIARVETTGVEVNFGLDPRALLECLPVSKVEAGYAYLDSNKSLSGLQSKYVLDHLKHQAILSIEISHFFELRQNWKLRYEKRLNGEDYFVVDMRIDRRIENIELFVEVTNLCNEDYTEVGDIPMPGRWVFAGLQLDFP